MSKSVKIMFLMVLVMGCFITTTINQQILVAQDIKSCLDDLDRGFKSEDIELIQSAREAVLKMDIEKIIPKQFPTHYLKGI